MKKIYLKKAFRSPFKDNNWISKILIGGLISAIPIAGFIAYGYLMLHLHSLLTSENNNLPRWTDISVILKVSLKLLIVALIYVWPIVVLYLFIIWPYYSIYLTARMKIIVGLPFILFVKFFLNIAYVRFAKSNFQISAVTSIGETFKLIKTHFKKYFIVYLYDVIAFLIINLDLMIFLDRRDWIFHITRLPITTLTFYLYLVINSMLAMVFRESWSGSVRRVRGHST